MPVVFLPPAEADSLSSVHSHELLSLLFSHTRHEAVDIASSTADHHQTLFTSCQSSESFNSPF